MSVLEYSKSPRTDILIFYLSFNLTTLSYHFHLIRLTPESGLQFHFPLQTLHLLPQRSVRPAIYG